LNSLQKSGKIGINKEICHGCGICELACSLYHEGVCSQTLSRIYVRRDPLNGECAPETCRQCDSPECFFACPVDAIVIHTQTGARIIVEEDCIACGKCSKACPFNEDGKIIGSNETPYFKCDLCSNREKGPICVEACPWGALEYLRIVD